MLNKLIEYVLSSATVKELRTEKGHKTRGTINLWINSPYGTGKSSSITSMMGGELGVIVQDYSMPGLIGTIKKEGLAVVGDIKLLPNTTAFLEEFQNTTRDERGVMLSLMEDHTYTRTLGFEVLKPEHIVKDGFGFIAEGTRISIYLQASFVIFSMTYRTPTTLDTALLSRCIPLFLDTAKEEQTSLFVKGRELGIDPIKIKKTREELKGTSVIIPEEIRELIASKYTTAHIKAENMTRAMWDYARIAFLDSHQTGVNELTEDIIDNVEWLVRIQELGYAKRSLTRTAYEIFMYLVSKDDMVRAIEIGKKFKLSREYTSRQLSDLVKKRLINKASVSKKVVYWVD